MECLISRQGHKAFLFSELPRPAPTQPPIRWVSLPGGKAARQCVWPLTDIWRQNEQGVELYRHSPYAFMAVQWQLYLNTSGNKIKLYVKVWTSYGEEGLASCCRRDGCVPRRVCTKTTLQSDTNRPSGTASRAQPLSPSMCVCTREIPRKWAQKQRDVVPTEPIPATKSFVFFTSHFNSPHRLNVRSLSTWTAVLPEFEIMTLLLLQRIGREDGDWINPGEDRVQCWGFHKRKTFLKL